MTDLKDWLEAGVAAATLATVGWKVILPASKWILRNEVVFAAQIAVAKPTALTGHVLELERFLPFPPIPSYSHLSSYAPEFPPKAGEDRRLGYVKLEAYLSGEALRQAKAWEATVPPEIGLGCELSGSVKAFVQTIARLRWYLEEKCGRDLRRIEREIGSECAIALQSIEDLYAEIADQLPTRVLVIRIKNNATSDAEDLKVDIGCGGVIYDVVVNDQLPDGKIDRTSNRYMISWPVMQPGFVVDIRLWYKWSSFFGSRMISQSPSYPGYEGIIINHIGISNGKVTREPQLLRDLKAWESMEISIGKAL